MQLFDPILSFHLWRAVSCFISQNNCKCVCNATLVWRAHSYCLLRLWNKILFKLGIAQGTWQLTNQPNQQHFCAQDHTHRQSLIEWWHQAEKEDYYYYYYYYYYYIIIVSFMQGSYTHIPETNHVPRGYIVAAILSLLFMVPLYLVIIIIIINLTLRHKSWILHSSNIYYKIF